MGSFDLRCFVSNLNIGYDDRLVVIPVIETRRKWSDGFYSPVGLPMRGVYDDYGLFNLDKEEEFDKFKKYIVSNDKAWGHVHFSQYINNLEDIDFPVLNYMEDSPLFFTYVREEVYDHMITEGKEFYLEEIEKALNSRKVLLEAYEDLFGSAENSFLVQNSEKLKNPFDFIHRERLYVYKDQSLLSEFLDKEEFEKETLAELCAFISEMFSFRMPWRLSGRGQQHSPDEELVFYKKLVEICEKDLRKWDE